MYNTDCGLQTANYRPGVKCRVRVNYMRTAHRQTFQAYRQCYHFHYRELTLEITQYVLKKSVVCGLHFILGLQSAFHPQSTTDPRFYNDRSVNGKVVFNTHANAYLKQSFLSGVNLCMLACIHTVNFLSHTPSARVH